MNEVAEVHVVDGVRLPDGRPETFIHIQDLPTLPWMEEEEAQAARETGLRAKRHRDSRMEWLKFLHYFDGKKFVYRWTERGKLVMRVWEHGDPAVLEYLNSLPREERRGTHVDGRAKGSEINGEL